MSQYKLVFSGEILADMTMESVKSRAISALKLSTEAAEQLFSSVGKAIVIKKVATMDEANQVSKKFLSLGMIVDIKDNAPPVKPAAEPVTAPVTETIAEPAIKEEAAQTSADINGLALEPVSPPPSIQQTEAEQAEQAEEEEQESKIKELLSDLVSYIYPTIILAAISLTFLIAYSPHSDGFLRKGFIAGLLLLFLAYRSFRNRAYY